MNSDLRERVARAINEATAGHLGWNDWPTLSTSRSARSIARRRHKTRAARCWLATSPRYWMHRNSARCPSRRR
jgi:hypothetical protein